MYYHPMALKGTYDRNGLALSEKPAEEVFEVAEHRERQTVVTHGTLIPVDGRTAPFGRSPIWQARFAPALLRRSTCSTCSRRKIMSGDIGPNVTVEMVRLAQPLAAGEEVLRPARELLNTNGIPCATTVLFGSPAQAIVQYVKERDIDAIVMGTRGMNALKSFVLGSVAAKVVGLADVPVTLVKSGLRGSRTSVGPNPRRRAPEDRSGSDHICGARRGRSSSRALHFGALAANGSARLPGLGNRGMEGDLDDREAVACRACGNVSGERRAVAYATRRRQAIDRPCVTGRVRGRIHPREVPDDREEALHE